MANDKRSAVEQENDELKSKLELMESKMKSASNFDVQELLTKLVPAVAMALKQGEHEAKRLTQKDLDDGERARMAGDERCPICGQRRVGCGQLKVEVKKMAKDIETGEMKLQLSVVEPDPNKHHVKMAVYPLREFNAEYFQGVWINGVRYLSNTANHHIWVPKTSHGDIARIIGDAEMTEEYLMRRKKRIRNIGSVSPIHGTQMAHGLDNPNNINVGFGGPQA